MDVDLGLSFFLSHLVKWFSNAPLRSAALPTPPCSHCGGANNHPRNGAQAIPAHSASLHSHSRTMQLNFPCVVFVLITVFHNVQKSGFFFFLTQLCFSLQMCHVASFLFFFFSLYFSPLSLYFLMKKEPSSLGIIFISHTTKAISFHAEHKIYFLC